MLDMRYHLLASALYHIQYISSLVSYTHKVSNKNKKMIIQKLNNCLLRNVYENLTFGIPSLIPSNESKLGSGICDPTTFPGKSIFKPS